MKKTTTTPVDGAPRSDSRSANPAKRSAVWSGVLSFGLVSIPIRLYAGARPERISFNLLCPQHLTRVQLPLFCPACERTIERSQALKGYEHAKGQYIVVAEQELKDIRPESASRMEITQFAKSEIDPLYFETSFYVLPDEGGERGYRLLQRALKDAQYIAIARVVMHLREHVVAIRPYRQGLVLHTLFYPDELREPEFSGEACGETEGELAICKQLIEALAADFEPSTFSDAYRENVLRLIQSKIEGKVMVLHPIPKKPVAPADLLSALQQSIAEAKASKELLA
jgi:DNA end-binding protein Ku